MLFIKNSKDEWWELDKRTMEVFNFFGGSHKISKQKLDTSEILECGGWHGLYEEKHFCPLKVHIGYPDVWISPDGAFYNGEAHENRAEEILEIIYGEPDATYPGDRLEDLGWVKATTSLMWEVRTNYWSDKKVTQKQYDALWDWCKYHNKKFPQNAEVR